MLHCDKQGYSTLALEVVAAAYNFRRNESKDSFKFVVFGCSTRQDYGLLHRPSKATAPLPWR